MLVGYHKIQRFTKSYFNQFTAPITNTIFYSFIVLMCVCLGIILNCISFVDWNNSKITLFQK
jgi:hypothetical protein